MTDLSDFLLARIGEDEGVATTEHELVARVYDKDEFTVRYEWARITEHVSGGYGVGYAPGAPSPARVLAECAAKRRIVDTFVMWQYGDTILSYLAQPYSEHPDYREEWNLRDDEIAPHHDGGGRSVPSIGGTRDS